MNLTTEWFEEKRVHEMLVFLGGEMRILLSMVNQCELEGGKRQRVAELDSLHNLWPTLSCLLCSPPLKLSPWIFVKGFPSMGRLGGSVG